MFYEFHSTIHYQINTFDYQNYLFLISLMLFILTSWYALVTYNLIPFSRINLFNIIIVM